MDKINIEISEDEALVLFEFLERFGDTETLSFVHAAEYVALMKLSAQIDKSIVAMFSSNYSTQLELARQRVADGFEGDVPGITTPTSES